MINVMTLRNLLKVIFFLFCAITTFLFLLIALQGIFLVRDLSFSGLDMLKLMSVSFVSVLPTTVYLGQNDSAPRKKMVFLHSLHFILTAGTVLTLLLLYGWIDTTNAIYIVLSFMVIYVTAHILIELRTRKLASEINKQINAFHSGENETHDV